MRLEAGDFDEGTRMGFLIHELRNALACIYAAKAAAKRGSAGENAPLDRGLERMRRMLDRAGADVRPHQELQTNRAPLRVAAAAQEAAAAATEGARARGVAISVRVDPRLVVNADRDYLASALENLLQNAVKFTPPGGTVWLRGLAKHNSVLLEIEDRCGGLPGGRIEELFEPFTQKGEDRSGLGLGLTISRRAVALNNGVLSARDIAGKGCVFSIVFPRVRGLVLPVGG